MNGVDAKQHFKVNGPLIGKLLDDALKWQILNRNGPKEELLEYLKLTYPSTLD